jgi:hypothetical protein
LVQVLTLDGQDGSLDRQPVFIPSPSFPFPELFLFLRQMELPPVISFLDTFPPRSPFVLPVLYPDGPQGVVYENPFVGWTFFRGFSRRGLVVAQLQHWGALPSCQRPELGCQWLTDHELRCVLFAEYLRRLDLKEKAARRPNGQCSMLSGPVHWGDNVQGPALTEPERAILRWSREEARLGRPVPGCRASPVANLLPADCAEASESD